MATPHRLNQLWAVSNRERWTLILRTQTKERRMSLLYIILIVVLVLVLLGFVGGRGRF